MKSFILKYASKIMFYDVNIACYHRAVGGPREAQVAHRARTRGRRPRVSTRVNANAREGRHVEGKADRWRAHGLVGPG